MAKKIDQNRSVPFSLVPFSLKTTEKQEVVDQRKRVYIPMSNHQRWQYNRPHIKKSANAGIKKVATLYGNS